LLALENNVVCCDVQRVGGIDDVESEYDVEEQRREEVEVEKE